MMFKPLSDALGLALALSFAAHPEEASRIDAAHTEAPTRWGQLTIHRDALAGREDAVMLDGIAIDGLVGQRLWIVAVEPISGDADRAVIAAAETDSEPPTRFRAVTITRDGAQIERGALELRLRGTAAMR